MIRHSHMDRTLDDSVAWKKAVGRRREDNTREKWWWWWWWRQWWWRWRWRGWMAMEMMMNDSWRESNIIYPRFRAFFGPTEGLLQGWHLSDSQNPKDMLFLHSEKFTQRRCYTQKPLHREGFTQSSFYTDAFAHRRFYTQKLLHRKDFSKEALPHWSLYEQLYTQTLFHKEVFTHRNFNAQMPKLLHTGAFAHTRLTKRSF